ncbi:MAG TPA: YdcF family protein [Pseudonocardiaceae bacterium]|nr:YdcF family protein [Pseudonocardiaceae bacterium]
MVVLGFRNRGDRANAINRWRVRAGLRSQAPQLGASRLVLCGGNSGGSATEAELMACYAIEQLGYQGELVLASESHSTWENVQYAIPLIEDVDRIKIVSHPLHAEKGRVYLARRRPELAAKLVPAKDYEFGEWILVKPLLAVLGLRNLRRIDRERRGARMGLTHAEGGTV